MAMFKAYFDESGTHRGSASVAVAGYVSTVDQWERFEQEWRGVLDDFCLEFFHMTDYENRQGPYKDMDDFRRKRLIERFSIVIKRRVRVPISAAVAITEYNLASQQNISLARVSPYTFCALQCLARVGEWADRYSYDDPIDYVFEAGAGYNKELSRLNEELISTEARKKHYRFDGLTTADKKQMHPLQAADFLAYEHYKEMNNCIVPGREIRRPRLSAIALLENHPLYYCGFYTQENLLNPTRYEAKISL